MGTPDETTLACPKIDGSEDENESEWRFPKIGIPWDTPNHPVIRSVLPSMLIYWRVKLLFWGSPIFRRPDEARTNQAPSV